VIIPERSRVSKQPDEHTREIWKFVHVKTSIYFSISSCLFLSCSLFSVHVRGIPIRTSFVSHVDDIRNLGVHLTFQSQQESVRFWKVVALFRCCPRHHSAGVVLIAAFSSVSFFFNSPSFSWMDRSKVSTSASGMICSAF